MDFFKREEAMQKKRNGEENLSRAPGIDLGSRSESFIETPAVLCVNRADRKFFFIGRF